MSDVRARLLLTAIAAVVLIGLVGLLVVRATAPDGGPSAQDEAAANPQIPEWALQPAVAAPSEPVRPPDTISPPLTIALGGDVHGEPPIADHLRDGGNPLAGMADVLGAADVAVVNLETAVGTLGTPADKTYTFQADPSLADALADAGVDVVTLANNHALDFGPDAAAETREVAEQAGLAVVGQGRDVAEATAPHVIEVDGRSVAVLGLSRVFPLIEWAATDTRPGLASAYDVHLERALQAVRDAAQIADHVVVAVHWGRERWTCPDEVQLSLAASLLEAGADVVAGHHPHVLQGVVEQDGALVAYSLGNLVFYARTPATRQSGVLTVTLGAEGVADHAWTPAVIDGEGRPLPVATQAPIPEGEDVTTTGSGPACGPPDVTGAGVGERDGTDES